MSVAPATEPEPVLPILAGFYRFAVPLSWPLIRGAAGLVLFVHGYRKVGHLGTVAASMGRLGIWLPVATAGLVTVVETLGALCVVFGLFTRFFAAACAIDLGVVTFDVLWPKGFSASHGGYELVLMWGVVMFAIALRGGGPYSLDRVLGREL